MSSKQIQEELKVALSGGQIRKLAKGGVVQIKPTMVGSGVSLKLDPKKARKIMRRAGNNKGIRLQMTEDEIMGSGLWDLIKSGLRAVNKVIPLRGIAKAAAKTVLPALATAVGGPAAGASVASLTQKYGDKVIDAVGDATGFGVMARGVVKGGRVGAKKQPRVKSVVADNSSYFIPAQSPAMHPVAAYVPDQSMKMSKPLLYSRTGGGVLPAGMRR